jgi:hypothetical protein
VLIFNAPEAARAGETLDDTIDKLSAYAVPFLLRVAKLPPDGTGRGVAYFGGFLIDPGATAAGNQP